MERDGLTEEEARRRMAAQPTNTEFIEQANVIFSTQWEKAYTQKQVRTLFYCNAECVRNIIVVLVGMSMVSEILPYLVCLGLE